MIPRRSHPLVIGKRGERVDEDAKAVTLTGPRLGHV
jgi:hypothetical protein